MKLKRIPGILCLVLALALIATAIVGSTLEASDGALGTKYAEATRHEASVSAHTRAAQKLAPSTIKKTEQAVTAVESAVKDTGGALADAARLSEGLAAGEIGDTIIDLLRQSGGRVETDAEALKAALSSVKDESLRSLLSENIDALLAEGQSLGRTADELTLALFSQKVTSALKMLNTAEDRLNTAFTAIAEVYSASDLSHEATAVSKTAAIDAASPEQALTLLNDLAARATELQSLALNAREEAAAAQSEAARVSASDTLTFEQRLILLVGRSRIGIMFTGALFLLAGIILLFFAGKFLSAWKRTPLFSTLIAALVMIVIQTYSLGFAFDSYGAWGNFWLVNFLNVLRANASVGMIALGMTFVIITGGIDLAVGSTLAGVATVVMVLLDTSAGRGVLVNAGITGVPNYLISIAAGLLTGVAIGALIGLGVTKGRVPPFIITLGVMNIVRSVAQYFTKSYKTEVPKEFQVLANKEIIGGQMLLPILYWVVLAIIMYVISKHTAFGRHIYAVGSNERTSRLSGINAKAVIMIVYALIGLLSGISGLIYSSRIMSNDSNNAGLNYEMDAILAVVIGGTSMSGGKFSLAGTIVGSIIIRTIVTFVYYFGIVSEATMFFKAVIIAVIIVLQSEPVRNWFSKRSKAKAMAKGGALNV